MAHGVNSFAGNAATGPRSAGPPAIDPEMFPGFTYLFGSPAPGQRSQLGENIAAARQVFGALIALLPRSSTAVDSAIPAGYTYLLQFLAHDMVQTTVPFWEAADAGIASRNVRALGLRLDTLYGADPTACPLAFTPDGLLPDDRTRLRLGRVQPGVATTNPEGSCPFRDLARINLHQAIKPTYDVVNFDNAFQVCIADPRNDASVILTQLTVLFSIAHNAIVDRFVKDAPNLSPAAQFNHARVALLRMYYAIITEDLLPRVLHESVWNKIRARGECDPKWLWNGSRIPLEFSHGAYRFGHAMVRDRYVFSTRRPTPFFVEETVVRGNRAKFNNGFRDPLPRDWVLEWARFFSFVGDRDFPSGTTPNFARKIAPRESSLDLGHLFAGRDMAAPDGVTLRDALSGAVARTWTIDALVNEIRRRNGNLIPAAWPFGDPDPAKDSAVRSRRIADWLTGLTGGGGNSVQRAIVAASANDLCRDLPLSLFVLLEAELSPDGRLGALGSIIVGEVIGKLLAVGMAELSPSIDAAKAAIGTDFWEKEIVPVTDMPALIKFAARNGGLIGCQDMPFITP
jgi:hypothetical protein